MIKTAVGACCLVAGVAVAQAELGVASQVQGLVTMSIGSKVGVLESGTPIVDGTRIVTGGSGSAVVKIGATCSVALGPNQMVTITADQSCAQLTAAVENVPGEMLAQNAGKPLFGSLSGTTVAALGGSALLAGVLASRPISSQ